MEVLRHNLSQKAVSLSHSIPVLNRFFTLIRCDVWKLSLICLQSHSESLKINQKLLQKKKRERERERDIFVHLFLKAEQ